METKQNCILFPETVYSYLNLIRGIKGLLCLQEKENVVLAEFSERLVYHI